MVFKESEKLELKTSLSEWREIIISLVSFANKKGGKVIVGITDKGLPSSLKMGKNTVEDFANKIKNNTDPTLYPSINIKTFGLGEIMEIEVSESDNKPVFAFDKSYVRVGRTNQKLSTSEIRNLIKSYTLPDLDEQSIDISRINRQELVEFFKEYEYVPLRKDSVSYGEYLCFASKNILFPNATIKVARFKGKVPVDFIDENCFDDFLLSAPEKIMSFIKRHINKQIIITGRAEHKEVWDYPLQALREAVTNAIVHRDYSDSGNIQIRIFDDRIEIWSPGLLPKEIKIAEIFKQARSIPRNRSIVSIFHKYNLIENWGTGFPRMLSLCKENKNPEPEFCVKLDAFVVIFKKSEGANEGLSEGANEGLSEGANEGLKSFIAYLKKNQGSNLSFVSRDLKIPKKTLERWASSLKKDRKIEFKGSKKKGGYFIIS